MFTTRRRRTTTMREASSASVVASNPDLLIEILLCLPVKSLLRFKSVSKRWLSLITDPYTSARHSKISNPIPSGIFLRQSLLLFSPQPNDPFVLLSDRNPLNPLSIVFRLVTNLSRVRILQSCNGLLLLWLSRSRPREQKNLILNPATKGVTFLPELLGPGSTEAAISGLTLAFDPSKSHSYKVVSVRIANPPDCEASLTFEKYIIHIYSSETGPWRVSGEPFTASVTTQFSSGVFWNGSVHWLNMWGDSLYFNVEEERLRTLHMPSIPVGQQERRIRYFGESAGYLNLIEIYESPIWRLDIYELKTDYSEWFIKYHVNLESVTTAVEDIDFTNIHPSESNYFSFGVISVVRGEREEDSFLVFHINGKVIRYDILDGTFTKLCDLGSFADVHSQLEQCLRIGGWFCHYPFIESLACV